MFIIPPPFFSYQDMKLGILDCGIGNSASLSHVLTEAGFEHEIISDPNKFRQTRTLIIPGVGSFDQCIKNVRSLSFFEELNKKVFNEELNVLGICCGAQVMGVSSEEGTSKGFGWLPFQCKHFATESLRSPHCGWNTVESQLFPNQEYYYFTHSFYFSAFSDDVETGITSYGHLTFPSLILRKNLCAIQFHPEKSHKQGVRLIQDILERWH